MLFFFHRPNLSMMISLMGGVLSIVGNLLLVPRLGIYGAAISSLCTSCIAAAVSIFIARQLVTFRLGTRLFWHGLLAGGVIAPFHVCGWSNDVGSSTASEAAVSVFAGHRVSVSSFGRPSQALTGAGTGTLRQMSAANQGD